MMGGQMAHEFMYLTPTGEDTLLICENCGYAANRQIARFQKPAAKGEPALPLEKVATPGAKTIEELANFLNIPSEKTAKAVFVMATFPSITTPGKPSTAPKQERFVFAIIRGDMDVNDTKLANALGATALRPATEEEIRAIGAVPGYASPIGLMDINQNTASTQPFVVVVDDLIPPAAGTPSRVHPEPLALRSGSRRSRGGRRPGSGRSNPGPLPRPGAPPTS